jgi:hypothetical protein
MRHPAGVRGREAQGDGAAQIDARDGGTGHPECGERTLHVLGLSRDSEIRIERPVGFAESEQIDRNRRVAALGQSGRDRSPEEPTRSESV